MPSPTWTKPPNGHQLGDPSVDQLADAVSGGELLPRILLRRLEREADALAVEVDLEDLHGDLVADGDDRTRMVDVLPAELGDVDEAVHAAEVDEGTEVDDARHDALADLARLEVEQELLALFLLGLLEPGAARKHDVVAVLVELDDLGLDGAADVGLQVAHPAQLDERCGEEAAQADVEDETTLDDLDDRALDDALVLLDLLDVAPRALVLRPLLGQDETTFLVLLLEDKGLDLLTERDDLVGIDVVADAQLAAGDHAFGLEADVEQDLVLVDFHHRSLDDVAVVELDDRGGDGIFERQSLEIVQRDLLGDVVVELFGDGCV